MSAFSAGLYCPGAPVRREDAPGTASGSINIVEPPLEFVVETQVVPAVPGLGFGVLVTLQPDIAVDVTVVVTHPPFAGTGVAEEFWISTLDGAPSLNGFTFEHDYELRPGLWTFSAAQDGEIIYTITFDVVRADQAPQLANVCQMTFTS